MYHALKGFFLALTAPLWAFPYAWSKYRQSRRPQVKVVVKNYRR